MPEPFVARWTKLSGEVETIHLRYWPDFLGAHVIFNHEDGRVVVEQASNVVRLEFGHA